MTHYHSKSLLDSLYCSEEHWEEQVEDEYGNHLSTNTSTTTNTPLMLLEQDLFCDDEELTSLLSKEQHNPLSTCLESNTVLALDRGEAVEWILRVNAHCSFSALTAVLAVNYLDRFLFSFRFQNGKPWLTHLAAVACFSLAAKVEETQVPLSVNLQVDSRYVFEAKTIKRMEILVLSTLGWKMNPATPLSFLDYITRRLGLKGYLCCEFLRRCEAVLLSVFADSRFMSYLPSVLATATMMHVVNSVEPRLGVELGNSIDTSKEKGEQFVRLNTELDKSAESMRDVRRSKRAKRPNQLLREMLARRCGFKLEKEKRGENVEECYKLMLELVSGYDQQGKQSNKRKFGSIPGSPKGVMDVSSSCDSSSDSCEVAAGSVSSSPEPLSKKTRTRDQLLLNHSNSDFLSIPR